MLVGIDHLVIACADLDAASSAIAESLELEVAAGGRHERLGTENRLVWLGDAYLELISVIDPGVAGGSWIGPAVLHTLERGGGLATFALASDELAADTARLRRSGASLGEPVDGERTRPDGETVRWRLGLPQRLGPDETPFLIEHASSGPEWGADARRGRAEQVHPVGGAARLRRLEVAVSDPARLAARYRVEVGLTFGPPGGAILDCQVGDQVLRLLPAGHDRPDAAVVIAISSGRPRDVDLLGCRFRLELAR